MLAVHKDAGDVGCGHTFVKKEPAGLWLTAPAGPSKDGDIVGTVIGDLTWERKGRIVAGNEYVVTAIIHQLYGIARAIHQPYEFAANGERWLRTNNLNCVDVARSGSGAIRDRAGLPGVGWLGKNRHGIGSSA